MKNNERPKLKFSDALKYVAAFLVLVFSTHPVNHSLKFVS